MGYIFRTLSGGHDDWVDAECLALRGCDPPLMEGQSHTLPTRKRMIASRGNSNTASGRKRRTPLQYQIREARYGESHFPDYIVNGEEVSLG